MEIDYCQPNFSKMVDFMLKQARFSELKQNNPQIAETLFEKSVKDARKRFDFLRMIEKKLSKKIEII